VVGEAVVVGEDVLKMNVERGKVDGLL